MTTGPLDHSTTLRSLPSVDKLLNDERLAPALEQIHHRLAVRVMRAYLDELREDIREPQTANRKPQAFSAEELARRLELARKPSLTRAIN
ncbi:hypothetical protein FJY70_00990, partial [candidate division WOR-3 bacterium]|nr:hypothetical protein [candidate division WOR-3 bacterium]